jgi:hypothetical protein
LRKTKSFSYDDQNDKKVIQYLESMSNASAYIVDLIKRDMNKKSDFSEDQKREIYNIIQQYIDENGITIDASNKKANSDIVSALNQFDDM